MVAQMLISLVTRGGRLSGGTSRFQMVARAFSTHVVSSSSSARRSTPSTATTTTPMDQRRSFHATVSTRKSAVEEDLDTALENILGEAFPEPNDVKEAPAPSPVESEGSPSSALVRTHSC